MLLLILGGLVARVRGPERAVHGALLGAAVAWAVHAGFDWDWEMPTVALTALVLAAAALQPEEAADPETRLAA